MGYEKIGFTSGQILKASDLNHMEEGIANKSNTTTVLNGTVSEITPLQVSNAIAEGRDICITYNHSYYGILKFTAFLEATELDYVVSGNAFQLNDDVAVCQLLGNITEGSWVCEITQIAKYDDIDSKLDAAVLPEAINAALLQAKASGEFDGEAGYTPVRGVDYWTEADKQKIIEETTENFPIVADEPEKTIFVLESSDIDETLTQKGKVADAKTVGDAIKSIVDSGVMGYTPIRGVDYWTETDKSDIIREVLASMATPVAGIVDENNNIIITANLPDGTYTMRYEYADGTKSDIVTISINSGPVYTNLADPTSSEWLTNKRINSSGNIVDVTEAQRGDKTVVNTNLIDLQGVSVLYVKGLDIMSNLVNGSSNQNYGRFHLYNSKKEMLDHTTQPSKFSYVTVSSPNVWAIDIPGFLSEWGYDDERYCSLAGILTGAAEDVIITADQNIVGDSNNEPTVSYTNQIPISTDVDGSIYNGTGFKSGYYISSSDGSIGARNGISVTGFIPVKFGDVIRLKNVCFDSDSEQKSNNRIATYDVNKNFLAFVNAQSTYALETVSLGVRNENNEWIELTVVKSDSLFTSATAYIRICTEGIGADSIITINEPIV